MTGSIYPEDAMPWVGLYVFLASLVCTLAMAADAFQGFRQRKLWFPCRFFTINAASLTLIAIAMKLPVDLNTDMTMSKAVSIMFLLAMLGHFLPSLGLMGGKDLVMNMIAFGILMITITINICLQFSTINDWAPSYHRIVLHGLIIRLQMFLLICSLPWPISVALTVSASRRVLQQQYKELHSLASNHQEMKNFSNKRLICYVKKYWMMAETDMEEYTGYVLHTEAETKLSSKILRKSFNSITQILHESEEKEPPNLLKLLKKSTGFYGVIEFDNEQIPPVHPEEIQNCWSLVTVTLTAIALSLPNTANGQFKGLISSMSEGIEFVRHIEESLNTNGELVKARKAARHVWTDVEVYRTWLQIDLQKKARKGDTSKEILLWLGDEAVNTVIQFKRSKDGSPDHSLRNFIAASSMYRISQTILLHCNEQENWPTDEELFEFISTIIADLLCACFSNLPRVITLRCHVDAIEKREDSIRTAVQLLGRSKKILKILKEHQLPNLDIDSMGYIDKWHALPKNQIPNCCFSSARSQLASSSSSESIEITIV
ncbi:uncharacterized protein LOC111911588 isoform X2 [Lactuca sativa]|uniref:uncharacterized protein LOC111911588 isoform X2 n=1 Tax=Lactuca sativa TaxID=4236 RepID=UPI0022AF6202|nr:uncharacterized protein LOC111911588 isoform X2 [Lactuca sativa]